MSATLNLTRGYGSFFLGCGKFAISPYTETFWGIATPNDNIRGEELFSNVIAAGMITGVLTFVVPVLPVLCSITSALAAVAATLAVASMFILYPIALFADMLLPSNESMQFSMS